MNFSWLGRSLSFIAQSHITTWVWPIVALIHTGSVNLKAHRSESISFEDYQQMLHQAVGRLPVGKAVVLLADRGLVHSEPMRMLAAQYRVVALSR